MLFNEETADFRKVAQVTDKRYVDYLARFLNAKEDQRTKMFFKYCNAVIAQKNKGALTVRESAYAISVCGEHGISVSAPVNSIIKEALSLRRHPSNYKEDHHRGWKQLVKRIATLDKKS